MRPVGRAVGPHADDVLAPQVSLVDARRRDPDLALLVAEREVAAGGGGHAVAVDPLDRPQDRIARMGEIQRVGHVQSLVWPTSRSRLLLLCGRLVIFARDHLRRKIHNCY